MIDLQSILVIVSETCRVKLSHLISDSQRADIVDARSLYIYFAKLNGYKYKEITTPIVPKYRIVSYHLARVRHLVRSDRAMRDQYADCSLAIRSFKRLINKHHG